MMILTISLSTGLGSQYDRNFKDHRFLSPVPVRDPEDMHAAGYEDEWIVYGSEWFSAKG